MSIIGLFSLTAHVTYADDVPQINIIFDGIKAPFSDACFILDGRIMIPLRALGEYLNMHVIWDDDSSTATLTYGNDAIRVTEGSSVIRMNSREIRTDVPMITVNDCMYLPLRAVAEGLGMYVSWEEDTYTSALVSYSQVYGAPSGVLTYPVAEITTTAISDEDKIWLKTTLDERILKSFQYTAKRVRGTIIYSTNYGKYDDKGCTVSKCLDRRLLSRNAMDDVRKNR